MFLPKMKERFRIKHFKTLKWGAASSIKKLALKIAPKDKNRMIYQPKWGQTRKKETKLKNKTIIYLLNQVQHVRPNEL